MSTIAPNSFFRLENCYLGFYSLLTYTSNRRKYPQPQLKTVEAIVTIHLQVERKCWNGFAVYNRTSCKIIILIPLHATTTDLFPQIANCSPLASEDRRQGFTKKKLQTTQQHNFVVYLCHFIRLIIFIYDAMSFIELEFKRRIQPWTMVTRA